MPLSPDDRLRCMGAANADANAIVRVRRLIGEINYRPIHPGHVRKLAAREQVLKPLRVMEAWLMERLQSAQAAVSREE